MSHPAYEGKICVVTGGASGIGRALCALLVERGAKVTVADLDEARAASVASALGASATAARVDVTQAAQVQALLDGVVARHGRLDYVFNNAGIAVNGEVRDTTLADFDRVLAVNLHGVVHGSLAAYAIMVRQGAGHIVNTASLAGLVPSPGLASYVTSKFAVVGLSESLRVEGAALGVKVSVICPGFVRTPLVTENVPARAGREPMLALIPMRLLDPEDAARRTLDGVARDRGVIAFPAYAPFIAFLYRNFGWLVSRFNQRLVRRQRAIRR